MWNSSSGVGEFLNTRYGRVAGIYVRLVWLSGPGIDWSRRCFLGRLPLSPKNPLIVGCGAGKFAADFVRREQPPRLTVNDAASAMLSQTERAIKTTGWRGELIAIEGDAADLDSTGDYDFIALQYVLTCFHPSRRVEFLDRIMRLMKHEGWMLISDYSRPKHVWSQPWFYLNYWAAVAVMLPLAGNPPHPPGDVERAILDCGLTIERKQSFGGEVYSAWLVRGPVHSIFTGPS